MAETTIKKLKVAPCQTTCPAGIDVPRYIRFIRAGKFTEAVKVIRESIPFPAVCAYACLHPCEEQCTRAQYDQSLSIRMLKRAAVDLGEDVSKHLPPTPDSTGYKIAVVGSGPAGLTAAYYLAGKGHQVTIFEKRAHPGGLMRYGIPEYRLPTHIVDREIDLVSARGVEIKTNCPIDKPSALLTQGFNAVCVAAGAWESVKSDLSSNVDFGEAPQILEGLAFLEVANTNPPTLANARVIVVGGGNSAIDASRTALRLGAGEVTLVYRRSRSEMPANQEEVADALEEGVKFEFMAAPVEVGSGQLVCAKTVVHEQKEGGRPSVQLVPGSEFNIPCNHVILALGQSAAANSIGIPADFNGRAVVLGSSLAVEPSGVYAAGDIVKGPSSLIEAIAQGRQVAGEIDKALGGNGLITEQWTEVEDEKFDDFTPFGQVQPCYRRIPQPERLSTFRLAECGYDQETAITEASRCLGCDIHSYDVEVNSKYCKECGFCKEVCQQGVFEKSNLFNGQGFRFMVAASTDKCVCCQKCLMICPDFAIAIHETKAQHHD